jgi:heat shock protein HtpX
MATTTRTAYGRDLGLQARMLVTMLLLGLLYLGLVGVLLWAGVGAVVMLFIVAGLALAQLFLSDKLALRAIGAHEVSPSEAPGLHALVERLCVQADLPKPKIAIANTDVPNAFATGRSRKASTVCVTTGLLHLLEPNELEGVLAHELAHVRNRDVLIATIAASVAGLIASLGHMIQWGAIFGGFGGRSDDERGNVFAALAWALLAPIIAMIVQLAVSRSREFGADASGAELTGDPDALADALLALERGNEIQPYAYGGPATAHLFIVNPFRGAGGKMLQLFSTHPPIEARVQRLREMRRGVRYA